MASDKTILVVDDEAGLRKAIAFEFERRGFRVMTAENGREAERVLRQNAIDLVITDIRMPEGNGIELLQWIKSNQTKVPRVIFITAYADLTPDAAYDLGVEAIFTKPFDRKSLRETALRCLIPRSERWKKHREEQSPVAPESPPIWPPRSESSGEPRIPGALGTGGVFVGFPEPFPALGTRIRFDITLPALRAKECAAVSGEGLVRWSRGSNHDGLPAGCGIEFVELSDECRASIVNFIENHPEMTAFIPAK